MPDDELQQAKRRLSSAMLGKAGIHAFGINRQRQAVKVYLTEDGSAEQQEAIATIKNDAMPFTVEVEKTPPPAAT